jgi:Trk-type K+ transport system membrane component
MFAALIPLLTPILSQVFGQLFPDPQARDKAMADFFTKLQASDLSQLEVNKAEAQSGSLFIAGWRPFIGWVGGVAIAFQFAVKPMLLAFGSYFSEGFMTAVLNAPQMDSNMWELVTAMLGIGAMRSYEKLKGVASR